MLTGNICYILNAERKRKSMDAYLKRMLGDNEKVILATHRHWFVLLEQILVELVISAITIAIVTILLLIGNYGPLVPVGYLLLIIPLVSLMRDVLVWSNHLYIVTNLRVIQISGIINKNVIDSSLEKVNDVKMTQSFFGRIFNFGDIEVLTAAEMAINRFTRIGNPVRFKTAMLNAKVKLEDYGSVATIAAINAASTANAAAQPDIPTLIERLAELRQRGLLTEEEFQEKKAALLSKL